MFSAGMIEMPRLLFIPSPFRQPTCLGESQDICAMTCTLDGTRGANQDMYFEPDSVHSASTVQTLARKTKTSALLQDRTCGFDRG